MFMKSCFKHLAMPMVVTVILGVGALLAIGQNSDGIWNDSATGLTWTAKDNGEDISYNQAFQYCSNLELAGYSDWRLPTVEELQAIYDKSLPKKFKAKGDIVLGSANIWSGTMNKSGDVWSLSFGHGGKGLTPTGGCGGTARTLCVRPDGK